VVLQDVEETEAPSPDEAENHQTVPRQVRQLSPEPVVSIADSQSPVKGGPIGLEEKASL